MQPGLTGTKGQLVLTWEFPAGPNPRESLFVGLEAKVDEPFGSETVCEKV